MSVPPSFSDLGKAARDIFSKGFSKYQLYCIHLNTIGQEYSCYCLTSLAVNVFLFQAVLFLVDMLAMLPIVIAVASIL